MCDGLIGKTLDLLLLGQPTKANFPHYNPFFRKDIISPLGYTVKLSYRNPHDSR